MWEIWVLWVLRVLAGKVCHLEAERLERVGLEAAPGVGENFVRKSPDT